MTEDGKDIHIKIGQAAAALEEAQKDLVKVSATAREARAQETNAINKVNESQKYFDRLVGLFRKYADYQTDWGRPQKEKP